MNKVIITDKPHLFEGLNVDVINTADFTEVPSAGWNNYGVEFIPFKISETVSNNYKVVAVDYAIEGIDKYLIANHLITSYDAVLIFVSDSGDEEIRGENDFGLFRNRSIKLISKQKLEALFNDQSELERYTAIYADEFDPNEYVSLYQRLLVFDRHQTTNEWGAVKLLLNHGLTLDEIETFFDLPKTVFFKQKLREFNVNGSTATDLSRYPKHSKLNREKGEFLSNSANIQRVLLIDDNASIYWKVVLQKFFSYASVDCVPDFEQASALTTFSEYDLIFLDLRLPTNSSPNSTPKVENGYKLIEQIKGDNKSLHVPLIVFTASQKASTLNEILEKGADAMYVKEPPYLDFESSLDNYLDFISEVNYQIAKGKDLRIYWLAIEKIKGAFLPEVTDAGSLFLKSRIVERLEMFYGLIKKKHEEFTYNKSRFHYSSEVLPFMTLWSILNEVQECYYQKVRSTLDVFYDRNSRGYGALKKRDGTLYTYISKWHLKSQPHDIYLEKSNVSVKLKASGGFKSYQNGDYQIETDTTCFLSILNAAPFYSSRNVSGAYTKANTYQPEQKLSFQIAFILLEKSQYKASTNVPTYLGILKTCNEERNKLYLTHGEDASTNFHALLEKDKRLPGGVVFELFRLVSFLLTADESIV